MVDRSTKKLENFPNSWAFLVAAERPINLSTEGFRVNSRIQKHLTVRKSRIERRLDKHDLDTETPVIAASNIHYELAQRTKAISAGGIGAVHQMVKRLQLDHDINRSLGIFKLYLPYSESDHVLNIAYNLLAGGTCLEHLELRRQDEAYLDALGAKRIPDPTTAGDFCRRFTRADVLVLMAIFNQTRIKVWKQQPDSFFDEAVIDADGTMMETSGQCKQGIDVNYKGQWGYHPLLVSLANTGEPLYWVNRSGNRPSHDGASFYLDRAVDVCRQAGFRRVLLRGDTDFSQTEYLDDWDKQGVRFVFGIDARDVLYERAESLPETAWKPLRRRAKHQVKTQPRRRPTNVKQQIVERRGFDNIRQMAEYVAEFPYRPAKCKRAYRVVVVWKDLEVTEQGQLFDKQRCFFYITNDRQRSAEEIVFSANGRCNQENLIEQHKNGVPALTAPLNTLTSNGAYLVIASLAWSLKIWTALLTPVHGRWRKRHERQREELLRMEFSTFQNAMIQVPAQILRTSGKLVYRLLAWNPWQAVFFRFVESLSRPLRC